MGGISNFYDKNPFGIKPLPAVEKILNYMQSGTVLDLGASDGRNSLFLASKGFRVTAVDISPIAIEKIRERAKTERLTLETQIADIMQFEFTNSYNLILCTFVLHHLSRDRALELIKKIKQYTEIGGLNIIAAFTKNGDFYRIDPQTPELYLNENELKDIYSDWEVLSYSEKEGRAFKKRPDGTPMTNVSAEIIAKK